MKWVLMAVFGIFGAIYGLDRLLSRIASKMGYAGRTMGPPWVRTVRLRLSQLPFWIEGILGALLPLILYALGPWIYREDDPDAARILARWSPFLVTLMLITGTSLIFLMRSVPPIASPRRNWFLGGLLMCGSAAHVLVGLSTQLYLPGTTGLIPLVSAYILYMRSLSVLPDQPAWVCDRFAHDIPALQRPRTFVYGGALFTAGLPLLVQGCVWIFTQS